jgi:flagellar hook-associated protein 1 FlgK
MSLIDILYAGRSGLIASQTGIQTAGQNVSNADVEGYQARSVVLSPAVPTNRGGRGVEVVGLLRASDPLLQRQLLRDQGDSAAADARQGVLSPLSRAFSELDTQGLGAALDGFWASFRLLSADPSDGAARQEVVTRGQQVASSFNDLALRLDEERTAVDDRIRGAADRLDELAFQIAELNEQIGAAQALGGGQELMDRRDTLVREVTSLIDTKVLPDDNGMVTVVVAGGMPLVERGEYRHVRVDPASPAGGARVEIEGSGWLDVTDRISGGALAGWLQARDVDIAAMESRLDQLAEDLRVRVNNQHRAGFGTDGVDDRPFFATYGSGPQGAALDLEVRSGLVADPGQVAAATNATLSGDNRNTLALAALADSNFAAGGTATFGAEYAAFMGQTASVARGATLQATSSAAALAQTESLWAQRTGVSVDEEMVDLIAFEKAYQAAAKLVSVTDQLYDTLLAMKR